MAMKRDAFCRRTRREFIWESGAGFGAAALSSMLAADGVLTDTASAATEGGYNKRTPPRGSPWTQNGQASRFRPSAGAARQR